VPALATTVGPTLRLTAAVADPLGERPEAENGVWANVTITLAEGDSASGTLTTDSIRIKGGDGVVYDDEDSQHNNAAEQQFKGEGHSVVSIDIPRLRSAEPFSRSSITCSPT
jgi:hypothetical protein